MSDNSDRNRVLKLPLGVAGFVVLCLLLSRPGREVSLPSPHSIDSATEAHLVKQGIESGLAELAAARHSLSQVERNLQLRLKLDETPERKWEVAGGLYAVASQHLANGHSPEATRVAQQVADLVPGSILAARCWYLCGQASEMVSPDLPLSIRYFERAEATLHDQRERQPDEAERLQLLGQVLQRLSLAECRFARHEEAIRHLRVLTGTDAVAMTLTPGEQLRAIVGLSQQLSASGHRAEAEHWDSVAMARGTSDSVPAGEALHILAATAYQGAAPLSGSAVDRLRTLWETQRFESLPKWFQLGDELTSAYFFQDPPQRADFELVSRKLLITLSRVLQTFPPDSTQQAELESLYATNLLLAADAARSRADQTEFTRLVKLFETTFHSRDVNFISPLARPAVRMHCITEIYRSTMTGHAEQLRKIQATEKTPPRL